MRILYMGTPEIAATVLESMINLGNNIVAVVTGEDKQRGRGNLLSPTPTKQMAEKHGIPVYTPKTLRDDDFLSLLDKIKPDIIVVVAYGKILPKSVLDYPRLGCINLHVSLLPKYRGAAPMQRAIMMGESETGVTVMYMAEGLDTGDIIEQKRFPIGENDDFETVHDRSAELGGPLLTKVISDISEGLAVRTPQDESQASYAPKVEKSDAKINFAETTDVLHAKIRGVTPIPGAFCRHGGKMLKIFAVTVAHGRGAPGEVIALDDKGEGVITVATSDGALEIRGVIPEGRGRMSAGDYIRGRKIQLGDILE